MAGGRSLSTENDSHRGLALAPGLQTHGQRVAHRNSTHSFALDKTFRFIDGMTKERAVVAWKLWDGTETFFIALAGRSLWSSQGDEKRPGPATTLYGTTELSFVIPSEAERICSSADLSWKRTEGSARFSAVLP